MSEQILVVKRKLLPELPKMGLFFDSKILPRVLPQAEFLNRIEAESNDMYKQLIPYSILRFKDCIFRYKRSTEGYESRLKNIFSIGVGGHINTTDIQHDSLKLLPLDIAREREIREEFRVDLIQPPKFIAFLNDDTNDVGRVHLGIIYEYYVKNPDITSLEENLHEEYGFVTIDSLIDDISMYENWSRIITRDYLQKNTYRHYLAK